MSTSVWSDSVKDLHTPRPALDRDIKADVLVVGGGIAGVLVAHRLTQAGIDCVIAEAKTIGGGITKNTTAKITAQHSLIYADLIQKSGIAQARLYLSANQQAVEDFRALAEGYPCDFEEKSAFVYSTNDKAKLEREAAAYQKLGLASDIQPTPHLPFKTVGAVRMERQAQFNPLKLLLALANGLNIYENTFVQSIDGNTAVTAQGKILAKHMILATHYPLVNIPGIYFLKLYQHRSYVIALENAQQVDGMYIDESQSGYSLRSYQNLLLIGGGSHRTGKPGGGYAKLRAFAGKAYPKSTEHFHWATQDCMSIDSIPYIGKHRAGAAELYVATGFNKWGVTGSMVAAKLLFELIVKGKSELAELYSPQRSMLHKQLLLNTVSAAAGLLSPGGPRCAHMGCKLHWNHTENTWDCSCHGSRFDKSGHLIDNPAKHEINP